MVDMPTLLRRTTKLGITHLIKRTVTELYPRVKELSLPVGNLVFMMRQVRVCINRAGMLNKADMLSKDMASRVGIISSSRVMVVKQ